MNTSTTPLSGENYPQQFVQQLLDGLAEGQREACRLLWVAIKDGWLENWYIVLAVSVVLFALAITNVLSTGRWGFLASVLYHHVYLGLLFVLILAFGPEIFAHAWIDILLLVLYALCFKCVGIFVNATGFRNQYGRRMPH
ncbi:MAG: hypothetical protein HQ523_06010 [Lentisphaerae bacterium]|nr:hypothetical protein [Lentisphaerota bacterium]